jgi:spectrin beta
LYLICVIKLTFLNCLLQKFRTELSTSSKRVKALDTAVMEFVEQGHSEVDKVQARQKHVHQMWDNLKRLKGQKDRSFHRASRY